MDQIPAWLFAFTLLVTSGLSLPEPPTTERTPTTTIANIKEENIEIKCGSHEIRVKIPTPHSHFYGMIYPKGLSKNSSCLQEYSDVDSITYHLPLRSCNTMMSQDSEFFNTIILEPHPKLVTGFGRGFNVKCKYQLQKTVTMKILRHGEDIEGDKTGVKIGDPLKISIESHEKTPFIVTDCNVRDGLGWAEQQLVNSEGCPVDPDIMPEFTYNGSIATVEFLAHKFPYSPSVYYACNVKFCHDCEKPECVGPSNQNLRKKRGAALKDEEATIEVFDGLWVNENNENDVERLDDKSDALCFAKRDFALAIAFSGLFLMIAVLVLLFVLCLRRRKKGSEASGSSIYSGGFTNTAYSHSS